MTISTSGELQDFEIPMLSTSLSWQSEKISVSHLSSRKFNQGQNDMRGAASSNENEGADQTTSILLQKRKICSEVSSTLGQHSQNGEFFSIFLLPKKHSYLRRHVHLPYEVPIERVRSTTLPSYTYGSQERRFAGWEDHMVTRRHRKDPIFRMMQYQPVPRGRHFNRNLQENI